MTRFRTLFSALLITLFALPHLASAASDDKSQPLFAVIEVTIKDRDSFIEYVKGHLPTIPNYGGSFLTELRVIEQFADPSIQNSSANHLYIIQKWPDRKSFDAWWTSAEYAPWKSVREKGADVSLSFAKPIH